MLDVRMVVRGGAGLCNKSVIAARCWLAAIAVVGVFTQAGAVPPDDLAAPSRTAATGTKGAERVPPGSRAASQTGPKDQQTAPSTTGASGTEAVPYPHPLIVEVLYAVPTGPAGDANRDGERSVNGDEFVEIMNPHDRPIQLEGYTLTDSTSGQNQFRFTFPKFELAPGAAVVVFNGNDAKWPETLAVGDAQVAPGTPSASEAGFGGAWLFSAGVTRSGVGFANESDLVMLSAPASGAGGAVAVQRVWWGSGKAPADAKPLLDEHAPSVIGASVQRESALPGAAFKDHHNVTVSSSDGRLFSPGVFPGVAAPARVPMPGAGVDRASVSGEPAKESGK